MATTPTQRTLKAMRDKGRVCGIVERFNIHIGPHGIRQDLFHFIDIIAMDVKAKELVAIQSCGQAFAEHHKKILETAEAPMWLHCYGKIELWGWRKLKKKRGGKAMVWVPQVRDFTMEDFVA